VLWDCFDTARSIYKSKRVRALGRHKLEIPVKKRDTSGCHTDPNAHVHYDPIIHIATRPKGCPHMARDQE
jgi:hypothetical protein